MLSTLIPNYEKEIERLHGWGPAGFVLAFNLTFRGPEHLHSGHNPEWQRIYEDRNYLFSDPILIWTINKSGFIRWSEINLPDIRGVLPEARKFNLNYGAAFSRKTKHKRSFLTLARADREFTDTEMEVISGKFENLCELVVGRTLLTDGELDVLRLLKDGYGQRDIAETLDVSESTVKQRALKACRKLDAKTRAQAVAICVARNYFDR